MTDYIDAPIPYIVGIPRDTWNKIKANKKSTLPPEVAIYDIDERTLNPNGPIPAFPGELAGSIYESLIQVLNNKDYADNVSY